TTPYGFTEAKKAHPKAQNKLVGIGTSFFWHQLLSGDSADSIPGLPKLAGFLLNAYVPTKATNKAQLILNGSHRAGKTIAFKTLNNRKAGLCGIVTAAKVLAGVTTDTQAFTRIKEAYIAHYGSKPFKLITWRGDTIEVTAGMMMLEQARLLWMLRTHDDDVLKFFGEI
ncbi:MAG: hypothetical protein KAS32_11880, partial [Candidatus Peribacteraceae bacterium]|nr:hypothetical protein [Candidatus Peribacteraceae bacterium]